MFSALFSSLHKKKPTSPPSPTASPTASRTANAAQSSSQNHPSPQDVAADLVLAPRRSTSPESEDRFFQMDVLKEKDRGSEGGGRRKRERNAGFVVEVEVRGKRKKKSAEEAREEKERSPTPLEKVGRKKVVREEEEEVAASEEGAEMVEDEEEEVAVVGESAIVESDESETGDEEGSPYGSQDGQEQLDSGPEDAASVSAGFEPISASTKKQLDDVAQSRAFKVAIIEDDDDQSAGKFRRGDIMELLSGTLDETWLAELKEVRGLESDIAEALDSEGNVRRRASGQVQISCRTLYLRSAWLYSAAQFREVEGDTRRFKPHLKFLGENELVRTDHSDWVRQGELKSAKPETIFLFDDSYPIDSSPAPRSHPLSLLGSASPSFLFGDNPPPSCVDDEFAGAKYARASFEFKPSKATIDAYEKSQGKRKSGKLLYGTKGKLPGPPLTLNPHSLSNTPYNPSVPQHFSHHTQTWYSVTDLRKITSYKSERSIGVHELDEDLRDEEEDDSDASTDYDEPRSAAQSSAMKRGRKPKVSVRPKKKTKAVDIPEALDALASEPIVRGGVWGLTGNALLVTWAREIVERVKSGTAREKDEENGERLVEDAESWRRGVEARREEGDLDEGSPPEGMVWVCPEGRWRI